MIVNIAMPILQSPLVTPLLQTCYSAPGAAATIAVCGSYSSWVVVWPVVPNRQRLAL